MPAPLSKNEDIKAASKNLRGTISEGLEDVITGAIAEDDTQLTKFHGTYQQDDRDLRPERRKKKLEPAYSFMIRVRVPGGVCTPEQWLALDRIADAFANQTLRLTTRQAFQFHGVIKNNLKRVMQQINAAVMDTIAACGDVNRNVMCSPNPYLSQAHAAAQALAQSLSDHLTPATGAYHEIWLDGAKMDGPEPEQEPIYGATYLPRKFKTVVAVPPDNDVDVYAHDLGFVADVTAEGEVAGYTVMVGGGMGMSHGEVATFPRTAEPLGFCTPEQAVAVGEAVVTTQRDWGDRSNRKHARLKYTIEDRGLAAFRAEVEKRAGFALEAPREFTLAHNGDRLGWCRDHGGKWHLCLPIENGRIGGGLKTALRKIAAEDVGEFRLTPNQNLIIALVPAKARGQIDKLLADHGVGLDASGLRRSAMACVGLPTCGLALAESERYLPDLVGLLEPVLTRLGLGDEEITIRMTGCPNGCARPFLAEIGLVGRGPGLYNLYLGAAFNGSRLNKLYRSDLKEAAILANLTPLFERFAAGRRDGERFGDFLIRDGVIKATLAGRDFHDDVDQAVTAA